MAVSFPDARTLSFEATLSRDANFALNGQILIPPYGDLYFLPGDETRGFRMGGRLDLNAFLPESWEFNEVSRLPTGAFFPPFVQHPLVEVPLSDDLNAYFGVRGQRAFGIAWSFIRSTSTPIGIGADYYDSNGNRVLGALFYPPVVQNGEVVIPGGLFLATDFSPYTKSGKIPLAGALRVVPYVIEGGVIREFRETDSKTLQFYQTELGRAPIPVPLNSLHESVF